MEKKKKRGKEKHKGRGEENEKYRGGGGGGGARGICLHEWWTKRLSERIRVGVMRENERKT